MSVLLLGSSVLASNLSVERGSYVLQHHIGHIAHHGYLIRYLLVVLVGGSGQRLARVHLASVGEGHTVRIVK